MTSSAVRDVLRDIDLIDGGFRSTDCMDFEEPLSTSSSMYTLARAFLNASAADVAKTAVQEKACKRRVSFDFQGITYHDVTPYSEVYGVHPRELCFHKYDTEPSWSFIADPDAADVDESELEEDEDDEGPQPVLTRGGFCKPPINPQTAVAWFNGDERDDDDVITSAPGSTEGSVDFSTSSDSSTDEDGLPLSPSSIVVCELSTSGEDDSQMPCPARSGSSESVESATSTKRCFARCVPVEWCSATATCSTAVTSNGVARANDVPEADENMLHQQLWVKSVQNMAVLFCTLPMIMSKIVSSRCKKWWESVPIQS